MIKKLALNQFLQFSALAVLLFVPAASFDWQPAWIFLAVFSTSSLVLNIYLLKRSPNLLSRRLKIGPQAESTTTQKIIQFLSFSLFAMVIVVASVDYRFSWSPKAFWEIALGDMIVIVGFVIRFLVFKANEFASATIEVHSEQTVIASGPYSLVRHPMYLSVLVTLVGAALALQSLYAILICIPLAITIAWRSLDEEDFLLKGLPGYSSYSLEVRYRLVPYIW
jgi:protein-S-isoprenylcysteine O-methyltransferase Ste14